MTLDARVPSGPIEKKWEKRKFDMKLVNPANKRLYKVIVVGSGLAGGSAAATLAELGYDVHCFCFQDSPRRAHSIAAQGGINAAKNYQNDGDSVFRLFYDTVKGGDYRSREANVYRLADVSRNIIDQCVAQGVPFARDYGGHLDNRSFGGAQVSRTFYAKGQTGQQLLLGAYSALTRQIHMGNVKMHTRTEMLDLVTKDGHAKGIITRDLTTGKITRHAADAVVLASGGYGNVFYLSTNAMGSNVTAAFRAYKRGAAFANPCYTQIHPTCIPVSGEHQSKLTLMSESLRNDGRVWVPASKEDAKAIREGRKKASDIPRNPTGVPLGERDYYLERKYPSFGNLVPRDVASRNAKQVCDEDRGVAPTGLAVFLDFADAIDRYGKAEAHASGQDENDAEVVNRLGKAKVAEKYGNLFQMYEKITGENPYEVPMKIYPAVHYTMGGLWVDYDLMSNVPGLFVLGEANFSDHGANRLGASALMQGLADGYFVIPYTVGDYLARIGSTGRYLNGGHHEDDKEFKDTEAAAKARVDKLMNVKGTKTVDTFHRELGKIMWEYCGMSRNEEGLKKAIEAIPKLRKDFWENVRVPGSADGVNVSLEKAGRVADFLEFGELMCRDALERSESCGGHFREESQTPEGEAKRNDEDFSHSAAWLFEGEDSVPRLEKEALEFEYVKLTQRSYK